MRDPFECLGVPEEADDATVKRGYLQKVRLFSPEQHPAQFQKIRAAFEAIRSERERLAYRLFQVPQPDLAPWILTENNQQRPEAHKILTFLATTLKTYRLPSEGEGS